MGALIAGGLGAAGAIGSSWIQSNAAKSASAAQAALGQQALTQQTALGQQGIDTLMKMFGEAKGATQPVIEAGGNVLNLGKDVVGSALPTLKSLLTPGASMTDTLSKIPGFQFAQDWGQKAVQNIGTTTGLGGNTLKAGADYATGVAQQGYGNIVNMLQNLLGSGAGLIGTGAGTMASGANSLAGAASGAGSSAFGGLNQLGQNIGQTMTGIGQANAAGTLGSANALAGGLTGAASAGSNALILKNLFSRFGGGGAKSSEESTGGFGVYGGASPFAYSNAPFSGGG